MKGTVSVVGAGTMGRGIAQVVVLAGYHVILMDANEKLAVAGLERLKESLEKAVERGIITAEAKTACLERLKASWRLTDLSDSNVIIEAVPESEDLKRKVLLDVERNAASNALIATNTSSISIDALAEALKQKDRFLGLHFFNPAPIMKLVEMVRGKDTSTATLNRAAAFTESLGKTYVLVKDAPGFVSNRILMPFINEAVRVLEEGIADRDSIDKVARLGFNYPMGPLELADFIGLDVCRDIMNTLYKRTEDLRFKPAEKITELVNAGKLGRKSGEGFYLYTKT